MPVECEDHVTGFQPGTTGRPLLVHLPDQCTGRLVQTEGLRQLAAQRLDADTEPATLDPAAMLGEPCFRFSVSGTLKGCPETGNSGKLPEDFRAEDWRKIQAACA